MIKAIIIDNSTNKRMFLNYEMAKKIIKQGKIIIFENIKGITQEVKNIKELKEYKKNNFYMN